MRRTTRILMAAGIAAAWAAASAAETPAERIKRQILGDQMAAPALQRFAVERLLPQTMNPVFIRAVKEQNARKTALAKVQALDKEWMAASSTAPFKTALLAAPASKELQRFAEKEKAVREAFVMDDQGAVVGETSLTSDYWQGDEKKWTESFKGGRGSAFIDAAQFDASARMVLQQISLPVFDEAGKAVGAVTWGVILDKIDWKETPAPSR